MHSAFLQTSFGKPRHLRNCSHLIQFIQLKTGRPYLPLRLVLPVVWEWYPLLYLQNLGG